MTVRGLAAWPLAVFLVLFGATHPAAFGEPVPGFEYRTPGHPDALRRWLRIMVWDYGFAMEEIEAATGLDRQTITAGLARFGISPATRPARPAGAPLRVAPWPGGRSLSHSPDEIERTRQRETKAGVFAPWPGGGYAVIDLPEAIRSQIGILYLAHRHLPTIWTEQGIALERMEWRQGPDGRLELTRWLPNGVVYTAVIVPFRNAVRMRLTLTNNTDRRLGGLWVQNCVLLQGLVGFDEPSEIRHATGPPYIARGTADGGRWVITAWWPGGLTWGNPQNPCLHSDPVLPDCPPGQSRTAYGWLSFYRGQDIGGEIARIERTGWRTDRWKTVPAWPGPAAASYR